MNNTNNFIMSPKVDFAFKELMRDETVRKGFLSAVLGIKDTDIKKTVLLNTNLPKIHEDEKQGILDVRLTMNNNTEIKKCIGINILDFKYMDDTQRFHTVYHLREDTEHIKYTDVMEIHIVELPKLPQNTDGTDLYSWIKFIKSNDKEEFEMLAQQSKYLQTAYKKLEEISADEQKRFEYTARQKALYDYNTLMEENYERGVEKGIEQGKQQGMEQAQTEMIIKLYKKGKSPEQIAYDFDFPIEHK